MGVSSLKVQKNAEVRLRAEFAQHLRKAVERFGSADATARDLGISRQRLQKYIEKKMTPKADVLLVAMANWQLEFAYEGIVFSTRRQRRPVKKAISEQLTLDYFDRPQVLFDDGKKIAVRVARKRIDRLTFAVEVRLAS